MGMYVSNRLFAEPSFIEGMSRVLDIGGTLQEYNTSATEAEADMTAVKNDWRAVGNDMKMVFKRHEQRTLRK